MGQYSDFTVFLKVINGCKINNAVDYMRCMSMNKSSQKYYIETLNFESYQTLPMPVFIKNKRNQYLWANDFFVYKSAGFNSLSDIVNKQDHQFAWRDYTDDLTTNDKLIFDSAEELKVNERILRYDGTYVDIVSKKCPVFNNKQKIVGLLGFSMELPRPTCSCLLSQREYTVVLLMSEGNTDKQIGKKCGLSPRTVEFYINNAKRKLGVTSRAQLIVRFSRQTP